MSTLLYTDPRFADHDMGPTHPECPARLSAVLDGLATSGVSEDVVVREPRFASLDEMSRVHDRAYLESIRRLCDSGGGRCGVQTPDEAVTLAQGIDRADGVHFAGLMTYPPKGQIEAVFLTHFHSDHIDGLGELMMQRWVNGTHTTPLPVYGPAGTEKIVAGFNLAYQQDAVYRVAHHGAATVPPGGEGGKAEVFGRISPLAMEVVYAKGDDLTVEAFNVEHSPIEPAIGYKVTYKDRSIVISGDTIKSAMVQKASQGVDVLIHEALSHELVMVLSDAAAEAGRDNLVKITKDILDYHTSPVEAAEVAQAAGVGMLLFSHIVPPLPVAPLKGIFLRGVSDAYDGPVVIGEDGTFVSLPAGSDVIETGNLK